MVLLAKCMMLAVLPLCLWLGQLQPARAELPQLPGAGYMLTDVAALGLAIAVIYIAR